MTKMAAMPYMVKSFKNFILWNQMVKIVTLMTCIFFFFSELKFASRRKVWKLD